MTADEIVRLLGLEPLPVEGGFYAVTYRSVDPAALTTVNGPRRLSGAIYYLLTPETFSVLHRLPGDEIYHFYAGDPVELFLLDPVGEGRTAVLRTDLASGMRPQIVAPGGFWQGSALRRGGTFALMGTTMSPGYHEDDFELGAREALTSRYPAFADQIRRLTR